MLAFVEELSAKYDPVRCKTRQQAFLTSQDDCAKLFHYAESTNVLVLSQVWGLSARPKYPTAGTR